MVNFLMRRAGLVVGVLMVLAGVAAARGEARIVAGPMIGHVGPTSARVWMQLNTVERVTLKAYDVRNRVVTSVALDVEGPSPFVFDGPIAGLEPERTYRVEVLFGDKVVKGADLTVRTAPAEGDPAVWTLALGSCMNPEQNPNMPVFKSIAALKPRAMVFLGDNGYLPNTEAEFPRTRREAHRLICKLHEEVRTAVDLQPIMGRVPTYAIWDDHDYGPDNANKEWVYGPEALTAFMRYWPNPSYGTPEAPGVFTSFTFGDVDVFMLDGRTYRDADGAKDRKTMLGEGQMKWLKEKLSKSEATFKVICSPTQVLADGHGWDTWGNYAEEREAFIKWLFENKVNGVVFVSGDRHMGELTLRNADEKVAGSYPLLDLTTSPLAAVIASPEEQKPNANRSGPLVNEINFGTLEFGGPRGKRHVRMTIRDAKGEVKVEQTVLADQLRAQ